VKLCPNGHENPDDADFCAECGQPLPRDESPVEELPGAQLAGQAAAAQSGMQPTPQVAAAPAGSRVGLRALLDRLLGRST
jgi:hypothetical protein